MSSSIASLCVSVVWVDREETGAGAGGARGLRWFTSVWFRMHHLLGLHIKPDQLRCEREYSLPCTAQNGMTTPVTLKKHCYAFCSVSGLSLSVLFLWSEKNLFHFIFVGRCDSDHSRRDWRRLYKMFSTHLPWRVQSERQRATTARH